MLTILKKAESESEDDSDDSDDSDSSESEEEKEAPKKRKAEEEPATNAKKSKTESADNSPNLFVGNLSWNVDEEWLRREFESFGELSGVRIMTERETGRSRG
jgi:nucleolin